jgi:hypothetical protein
MLIVIPKIKPINPTTDKDKHIQKGLTLYWFLRKSKAKENFANCIAAAIPASHSIITTNQFVFSFAILSP